jgi:hypothetical protein
MIALDIDWILLSSLLLLKLFEVFDGNISILDQITDGMVEELRIVKNLNSKRPWKDMVVAVVDVGVCDFNGGRTEIDDLNGGAASFCHSQLTLHPNPVSFLPLTGHDSRC